MMGVGRGTALAAALLLSACAHGPRPAPERSDAGVQAARHALQMVGAPYRYGGASPRGFDCSGLVHYSYAQAGVAVPRTTRDQRARSRSLALRELRPGDLLFFAQEGKRSGHVGLYIGDSRFVHAPSTGKHVRLSTLGEHYWRRHLTEARRFDGIP
jgi:murein DD-endopeptidase